MFYLWLIIRDFLGVGNQIFLQRHFAACSVLFFLAAAAATVLDVTCGGRIEASSRSRYRDAASLAELSPRSRAESVAAAKAWEKEKIWRLKMLVVISGMFAVSVLLLPTVQFLKSRALQLEWFYILVTLFGAAFGLGFSRFQDATWRLLPQNCDMANAMGFSVMARNFGLGVGNFFFGVMLHEFVVVSDSDIATSTTTTAPHRMFVPASIAARKLYSKHGYDFMFVGCMLFHIAAGLIAYRIVLQLPDPDTIGEAD